MPRKGGKKKKGKVVRADRDPVMSASQVIQAKLANVNSEMFGNIMSQSAAATATSHKSSNLDESQYTYYSESVTNQSLMVDEAEEQKQNQPAAREYDVQNIKADIEAAE